MTRICTNEEGNLVEVDFDFQSEQKQINYPTDQAQPHYPAEIEITSVRLSNGSPDIMKDLTSEEVDNLEAQLWDMHEIESGK